MRVGCVGVRWGTLLTTPQYTRTCTHNTPHSAEFHSQTILPWLLLLLFNCQVGIALKPSTPAELVLPYLHQGLLDLVSETQ